MLSTWEEHRELAGGHSQIVCLVSAFLRVSLQDCRKAITEVLQEVTEVLETITPGSKI